MPSVRARTTNPPAHARQPTATPTATPVATSGRAGGRRRFPVGLLVVAAIYAVAIGLNEWRLHQHVQAVRASQTTFHDGALDPRSADPTDSAPGHLAGSGR